MDTVFQQHAATIAVADGNYYNPQLKEAVEYFEGLQKKGKSIQEYLPQLREIYKHNTNTPTLEPIVSIFLRNAIAKGTDENVLELATTKSYGSFILMQGIKKIVAEGGDIYALTPFLISVFEKETYSVKDIILAYFLHKKHADARKSKILGMVDLLCEQASKHPRISSLIHDLLKHNYPEKDLELQKKWVQYPDFQFFAVDNLLVHIPKFYTQLEDVVVVVKKALNSEDTWLYSYTKFLTFFAFYKGDFALLDFLWKHKNKAVANSSIKLTAQLSVNNKEKLDDYFQFSFTFFIKHKTLFQEGFKEAFTLYFKETARYSDDQWRQLLLAAKDYEKKATVLFLMEIYAGSSQKNRKQLLGVLQTEELSDIHLQTAREFFSHTTPPCCAFCRNVEMKINCNSDYDLPKNRDQHLIYREINYSDGSLLQCGTCAQYYYYFYDVEYDVNSMHEEFKLEKTSPAHIMEFLSETDKPTVQENYNKLLDKALAEQYSPIRQLREAAYYFLARHYLDLKNAAAFRALVKTALPLELKICMKAYREQETALAEGLLEDSVLLSYLKTPYHAAFVETAMALGKQFVRKLDYDGILALLQHKNDDIKEGGLMALYNTPDSFIPNHEILQAIQAIASKGKQAVFRAEFLLKKYKDLMLPEGKAYWLEVLEKGKEEQLINTALNFVEENCLDDFDIAHFPKIITYLKKIKLYIRANSFYRALFKQNKLGVDECKQVLGYLKDKEARPDVFYYFDDFLLKNYPAESFLQEFNALLLHNNSEIASRTITLLYNYASKKESIAACVPTLSAYFDKKDGYENERMVTTVVYHYFYHEKDTLLVFLEGLTTKAIRSQAMSALSNLAEKKEDVSNFYDFALRSINEVNLSMKDSALRMLFYACKHRKANAEIKKLAMGIYGEAAEEVMKRIEKW